MLVGANVARDLEDLDISTSLGTGSSLAGDATRQVEERIARLTGGGSESAYALKNQMSEVLMEKVGIFRGEAGLAESVEELRELQERAHNLGLHASGNAASPEVAAALRLPGMLRLATSVAYGALQRTESRGSHYREDYPARDDANWLTRTLARWEPGADLPTLEYEPVEITELPPGDRGYGEGQVTAAAEQAGE